MQSLELLLQSTKEYMYFYMVVIEDYPWISSLQVWFAKSTAADIIQVVKVWNLSWFSPKNQ